MLQSPQPSTNPIPTFSTLKLDDTLLTGNETTVDDFKRLLEALKAKLEAPQSVADAKNPSLIFSSNLAPLKSPIIFLDFDGVCWVDDVDVPHQRYREFKKNEELRALITEYEPMLKKHYDFENVGEFLRFVCFDLANMQRIKKLCQEFNSRIVVISNWRRGRTVSHLQKMLDMWDLGQYVIDKTPDGAMFGNRAQQITEWLEGNNEKVSSYVILDDQYFEQLNSRFKEKFIYCVQTQAFTEQSFQQARVCLQAQCAPTKDQSALTEPEKLRALCS